MASKSNYRTIATLDQAAALANLVPVESAAADFGKHQCFMIDKIECFPPTTLAGSIEKLRIELLIDGKLVPDFVIDSRLCGPYNSATKSLGLVLGDPFSVDPDLNTCIKGNESVVIRATAMAGGTTRPFKVRAKGWVFDTDEALRNFYRSVGTVFNPQPIVVRDPVNDKSIELHRPMEITIENFPQLSGGAPNANSPKCMPWFKYFTNKIATSGAAGDDFQLKASLGNVDQWQDLFFNLKNREAYEVCRMGVLPHTNSSKLFWILNSSDYYPDNPYWEITELFNELPLGVWNQEQQSRITEQRLLIKDQIAVCVVRDNGTAIPANGLEGSAIGRKWFY